MTDNTNQTITDVVAKDTTTADTTVPDTKAVVVPLTKDQQASVQAELDKQNGKAKATTAEKPRVRAGTPQPKAGDKYVDKAKVPSMVPTSQPDSLLVDILCWPRRHDSPAEQAFIKWLQSLPIVQGLTKKDLSLGSWAWEVPGMGSEEVMFSCHVDTVDDYSSCQVPSAKKKLVYDPGMQIIGLDTSHKVGSCLGADDGAGIWLMLKMIEAKVPGTYVFHRGEECGGITAKGNVKDHAEYFKKRRQAIAFDRHMNGDVIIQQGGATCASAKYGAALAAALNAGTSFNYKEVTNGVYTDTKEYRGLVSECVNLSVGYQSQHGASEFQDWDHLQAMKDKLLTLKWTELPVTREPYLSEAFAGSGRNSWMGKAYDPKGLQDDFFGRSSEKERDKPSATRRSASSKTTTSMVGSEDLDYYTYGDLFALVDDDPEQAKDVMIAFLRERARLKADIVTLESIVAELK